ncbi:MAG: hypothetical protein EAZ61_07040 [Oscillatoriales cyanobacterium]|nr:MAG: hypothetical protein EAZ61_07040 [Oscillatoriales cyanobacterium]
MSDVLESSFDETFYLNANPDVVGFNGGAIAHFVLHGQFEGREPNSSFNSQGYLALNSDVQVAVLNGEFTPVSHYLEYGISEGRLF